MQLLIGQNAIFGVQIALMVFLLVVLSRFYLEYNIDLSRKVEMLLHVSAFVWGCLYLLEIMVPEYYLKNILFKLGFLNKSTFGTLILLYALAQYNKRWLSRNRILALLLCNVAFVSFFFTNDYHGLAWVYSKTVAVENFSILVNIYESGYYLIYGLNYALIAVSVALLVKTLIDVKDTLIPHLLQPVLMASILLCSAYYNSLGTAAVDYTSLSFIVLNIVVSVSKPTTSNIYEVFTTSRGILFDRMNDAIIMLNREGGLVDMNSYAKNVFADEEKFMSTINELTSQFSDDWKNLWVRYWHTGLERSEVSLNDRIFDVSAYPIFNKEGDISAQILVLKDITERKNLEKSLRSYSERLEDIVEERTRKLKDAERLAGIGETTAMVGHDLRNPLQAISGIFNIFKERYSDNEEDVQMVNRIERNLNYMNKIVSDLQSYTKPLTPNFEKINILSYVEKIVSTLNVPDDTDVVVDIPPEGEMLLDQSLFERVLNNMIMNSIQAMPDGGKIVIRSEEDGDYVYIHVVDEGVGIPEELRARIFTPLFTTKAKGTGLGLAVCKRIVEAHGGLISFRPNQGKGTLFSIKLPLSSVSLPREPVLNEGLTQLVSEPVSNNGSK